MLGGLWLIGTLGSARIEPPLRELVSQFEVWRGLDVARGPLDVNFEDTSPKKDDDATSKTKSKPASTKHDAKTKPSIEKKPLPKRKPTP